VEWEVNESVLTGGQPEHERPPGKPARPVKLEGRGRGGGRNFDYIKKTFEVVKSVGCGRNLSTCSNLSRRDRQSCFFEWLIDSKLLWENISTIMSVTDISG